MDLDPDPQKMSRIPNATYNLGIALKTLKNYRCPAAATYAALFLNLSFLYLALVLGRVLIWIHGADPDPSK